MIEPLLKHLLTNINATGLLREHQPVKHGQGESNKIDCEICGTELESLRSLRKHKRQNHIETPNPSGVKRKSMPDSLDNIIRKDKNASPPPKIRAVENESVNQKTKTQNKEGDVTLLNSNIMKDQEDILMVENV